MNYLDRLNPDIMNKILDILTDDYEKHLKNTTKKINRLNNKLKPLEISSVLRISSLDVLIRSIKYSKVCYCNSDYLFNNIKTPGKIVIINLTPPWINPNGTFISKILHNPTNLDVIIQANMAIKKSKDFARFILFGLIWIPYDFILEYAGISPIDDVNYYEFNLGSPDESESSSNNSSFYESDTDENEIIVSDTIDVFGNNINGILEDDDLDINYRCPFLR